MEGGGSDGAAAGLAGRFLRQGRHGARLRARLREDPAEAAPADANEEYLNLLKQRLKN